MFGIPGPTALNVLAGALFGTMYSFFLIGVTTTIGACCGYMLSYFLARGVVIRRAPSLLIKFDGMIASHRHNMFFYMTFLRITPILPSVFINYASPIVGVPLRIFASATAIGLIPVNRLHLKAGVTLATM
jgi:uncharacterized membrane protein YdjX (TVP38/TMEM64 family)